MAETAEDTSEGQCVYILKTPRQLVSLEKGMNIGFLNIQGICSRDMTKFLEIDLMMTSEENKNLSILSLCETKLKDNKPTSAFHINGFYTPFRKDNHTNADGGILVYVRNTILAKRRFDLETNEISCLWLEIMPEKSKLFLVGSQLIADPTRVTTVSSTLIDHIHTNEDEHISSTHVSQIQISDHYAIFCNRRISPGFKKDSHKTILYRSFNHFNDDLFLNDLTCANWNDIQSFNDIDSMIDTWYSMFTAVVDMHVPVKT